MRARFKRGLALALITLCSAAGLAAAPALEAAAACSYCLVIYHSSFSGRGAVTVAKDSAETCANSSLGSLSRGYTTREAFGWEDAGCVLVPSGYDMDVYDGQQGTHTCVQATGWRRLSEPPSPSSAYQKTVYLYPESQGC